MFIIIFIITILNLSYWIFIFSRFSLYKDKYIKKSDISQFGNATSVILAVKDEEENLKKNLDFVINQNLKGFELTIIDDHSSDETCKYLNKIAKEHQHIKILENISNKGKKNALTLAVSDCDRDIIVLTDADCKPASSEWLSLMASRFSDEKTEIVLGYSPYTGYNFLSKFIRFETFMTALQYFSYAVSGMPYMGVGRNMAFKKEVFVRSDGYSDHIDIQSGNDDLFVMANATSKNTAIQIDTKSFMFTDPQKTIKDFLIQKSRHISSSFKYKPIFKILLSLYSFSHIAFYLSLLILILQAYYAEFIALWLFRFVVLLLVSYRSMNILKEKDLFKYLALLDFLMFIYYIVLTMFFAFKPKVKWK
jgi:glycosyltransferase involved in cell wall biosynthesis